MLYLFRSNLLKSTSDPSFHLCFNNKIIPGAHKAQIISKQTSQCTKDKGHKLQENNLSYYKANTLKKTKIINGEQITMKE